MMQPSVPNYYLRFLTCCITCFLPIKAIRGADQSDTEAVIESFRVPADGDCLMLPVNIAGRTYAFVVDTSANRNFVDRKRVQGLRLSAREAEESQAEERLVWSTHGATIGTAHFPIGDDAIDCDLSELVKISGHDFAGILGAPFLQGHIIQFDCAAGTFTFLKFVPPSCGRLFPISVDENGCPSTKIEIPGCRKRNALLSTGINGAGATVGLQTNEFDRLVGDGHIEVRTSHGGSVRLDGREMNQQRGWLSKVTIGEFVHTHVAVGEGHSRAIGMGFFRRYVVTINFPSRQLFLRPGRLFHEADRVDLGGMALWVANGCVEIESVEPGTPAARAGLKVGERIIGLDGVRVSADGLFHLRYALCVPGARLQFEVGGSAGSREVIVELPGVEQPSHVPKPE